METTFTTFAIHGPMPHIVHTKLFLIFKICDLDDGGEGDHPNWAELIVFLKPATKLGETILKKEKYFELI